MTIESTFFPTQRLCSSVTMIEFITDCRLQEDGPLFKFFAEGKSTRDIASVLGISVKTAESHRTRMMHKLDIHETASLVLYAVRKGIVQP
jgi:hypothetical protein